jgi:acetylornithine deacetylase/succinyl-diaminopimelate desuccinylase-like protein
VATRVNAGHANNALPQMAQAIVNCRILPGHSSEEIRQTLIRVFDDPKITVRYVDDAGSIFDRAPAKQALPPPPLRSDVIQALQKVTQQMWPGIPVIPDMSTGASDDVHTDAAGIPSYDISGEAIDRDDIRAHGKDERIRVVSFYRAVDFYYRFLRELTSQKV